MLLDCTAAGGVQLSASVVLFKAQPAHCRGSPGGHLLRGGTGPHERFAGRRVAIRE